MTVLTFSTLLIIVSYLAGVLGALTGLGGGVVLIPTLVLLFHVDIHYAMGASLIAVMATSSGAALAYLKRGYTNIRIGMFLESAAVIGALFGAALVKWVPSAHIAVLFGIVMFISAYLNWKRKEQQECHPESHPWATYLKLDGSYPTQPDGSNKMTEKYYQVHNVPLALIIMGIAGTLSGLLGIGSGTLKVLAMDQAMHLPYKVSTTTSNFIIGMTAATSAGVYLSNGYMNAQLIFPVLIGVILGAFSGAILLAKTHNKHLRIIFSILVLCIGVEMIYKGLTGHLS